MAGSNVRHLIIWRTDRNHIVAKGGVVQCGVARRVTEGLVRKIRITQAFLPWLRMRTPFPFSKR